MDPAGSSRIGSDSFEVPDSQREPARRLRGRLVAPVTVWTANGPQAEMAGLTVSSVLVAEGEPPELLGLVGDLTELAELVQRSRRFVVHVLGAEQRELADRFAGRYPDSGFSGVELATSDWGPVLVDTPVRAYCDLSDVQPAGWSLLLRARLAAVDIGERRSDPLVHYLGRWARLSSRQDPG